MAQAKTAATTISKKKSKAPKLSREERSILTRDALFDATAKIVGEMGYPDAQVAAITAEAKVAHGTFYNYFESRQDLFDQLLPNIGKSMLERIQAEAATAKTDLEREVNSFKAFFDFLYEHPEFYRILFEARVFCAEAYEEHTRNVSDGYTRVLTRAHGRGEIKGLAAEELEAIAFMLMGAREYIAMRYARQKGRTKQLPEWVVAVYEKLVSRALYGEVPPTKRKKSG
ncbi:TetR/AcrR family transcriptional regulator [Variovorax sp. VNK109]|uniref:TetR/AcrR family transcriptional regulator n=1 Tax=Variovorax sp. VNK109 TaxID=3400919 RepID=UPI003C028FF7